MKRKKSIIAFYKGKGERAFITITPQSVKSDNYLHPEGICHLKRNFHL